MQDAGRPIPRHLKRQDSGSNALLSFLATGLQADITLSTQAPPQADPQSGPSFAGGTNDDFVARTPGRRGDVDLFGLCNDRSTESSPSFSSSGKIARQSPTKMTVRNRATAIAFVTWLRRMTAAPPRRPKCASPWKMFRREWSSREESNLMRSWQVRARAGPWQSRMKVAASLEGRLTVSAPWQLALADYRVKSGRTETIPVRFQPDEGRQFIGQITLTGVDGTADQRATGGRGDCARAGGAGSSRDRRVECGEWPAGRVRFPNESNRACSAHLSWRPALTFKRSRSHARSA